MTTEPIQPDSVLLSFDTLVRQSRDYITINGERYLLMQYEDLSFTQLAQIERRRRIVQQALQDGDADGAGDRALRELVEYLVPDAARAQTMWTPPATEDDPDPQPRPVKVTDTLRPRERMSIMNLFTDPSVTDAITRLAAGLLRGRTIQTEPSTSGTSSPDSPPPTGPHPSPAEIG